MTWREEDRRTKLEGAIAAGKVIVVRVSDAEGNEPNF